MKNDVLLDMLFELLTKRKLTAAYFADRYGLSVRSVYRYVDVLSLSVPLQVQSGRNGGIFVSDTYKLPVNFMTKDEYEASIEALDIAYGQIPEERFAQAKRKLSAQFKSETRELALTSSIGNILVDGGTWGDTRVFSDKMRFFETCIRENTVVEITYNSRRGEVTQRKIEPHVLVFKQGVWYIFAFCRKQRAFRLFRIGRIFSSVATEEKFNKKPVAKQDIPLSYWTDEKSEPIKLLFSESGFADALDWLGRESLKQTKGGWVAEISLPYDDTLLKKLVAFGKDVKVLAPKKLVSAVQKTARQITALYE